MLESPLIQDLIDDPEIIRNSKALRSLLDDPGFVLQFAEVRRLLAKSRQDGVQDSILRILERKFSTVTAELITRVRAIHDERQLSDLVDAAVGCADLAAFEARLPS